MKKYIYIGIGGFLGAVSRYLIKGIQIGNYHGSMPLNTLLINVTGSFILAMLLTVALEIWEIDESIRLGIATGFLGAYTTFSTLCKETVTLFAHHSIAAAIYITLSMFLGLLFAFLGVVVAREFIAKVIGWKNTTGSDGDGDNNDDDTNSVGDSVQD